MPAQHMYEAAHFLETSIDGGRLEFCKVLAHGSEGQVMLARNVYGPNCTVGASGIHYKDPYYVSGFFLLPTSPSPSIVGQGSGLVANSATAG